MKELNEIKNKLKQVSTCWTEIIDLSKKAIYDINDTNVNWNKKINFEENEQVIKERVNSDLVPPTPKQPIKLSKPPKSLSITGLIFTIIFGILFLEMFAQGMGLFVGPQGLIISTVLNAIGFIILTVGICLCKVYKNSKKLNETSPKKLFKIFGIISIVVGCLLVMYQYVGFAFYPNTIDTNDSRNSLLNVLLTVFGNALFAGMTCLGVCLIFFKKSNFPLRKIEYDKQLKQAEEDKKYNEEQLPKDIEEYEKNYRALCNEQIKIINSAHKKIGENFAKIEKIDVISISQAKYAQELLDRIYKGATSIKEAFNMLETDTGRADGKIEDQNIKGAEATLTEPTEQKTIKGRWKRLSKLAKAMILVPVITFAIPIILIIVAEIMVKFPSTESLGIGIIAMAVLIIVLPIVGVAIFESIGAGILIYRKHRRDMANIINNHKSY